MSTPWRGAPGNERPESPDVADAPANDHGRLATPSKGSKAILGLIALALTAGLGWLVSTLQPDSTAPASQAEPQGLSTNAALVPGDEVNRVHAALHDIGARCGATVADPATQQYLAADAEVIVTFAERYPDALFTVDDETGRALSLLFVARDELRICAPEASQRADLAIPAPFRVPTSPPGTPPS
jgi:hypothetical protein